MSSSTPTIFLQTLLDYRANTYRQGADRRVHTQEQAIHFVNERGFVYFWPVKGVVMPSLWTAVAGDRPVPNKHNDPGHVTWGWKDALLGARRWYYAKILRKKATFISLEVVPYFYALSENYGEPKVDYLDQYRTGSLSFEAKTVYETLLTAGPLDALELRKQARLSSRESDSRFTRALELLQSDFKVLPVGVAHVGAWNYAFVYDLVHRFYPALPEQARAIRQDDARRKLVILYLRSVGVAPEKAISALFGWDKLDAAQAVAAAVHAGEVAHATVEGEKGEWIASAELSHQDP